VVNRIALFIQFDTGVIRVTPVYTGLPLHHIGGADTVRCSTKTGSTESFSQKNNG
jgi:hypothetical protein